MSHSESAHHKPALERGKKRANKRRSLDVSADRSPLMGLHCWLMDLADLGHLADMTNAQVRVWLVLYSFCNGKKLNAFPSLNTIANLTGLAVSSVHRTVKELEGRGLIIRTRQGGGYHKSCTNDYTMLAPQDMSKAPDSLLASEKASSEECFLTSETMLSHQREECFLTSEKRTVTVNSDIRTGTGGGGGGHLFSQETQAIGWGHPIYDFLTSDKIKLWPTSATRLIESQPGLTLEVIAQEWENVKNDSSVKINRRAVLLKRLEANGPMLQRDHEQDQAARLDQQAAYRKQRAEEKTPAANTGIDAPPMSAELAQAIEHIRAMATRGQELHDEQADEITEEFNGFANDEDKGAAVIHSLARQRLIALNAWPASEITVKPSDYLTEAQSKLLAYEQSVEDRKARAARAAYHQAQRDKEEEAEFAELRIANTAKRSAMIVSLQKMTFAELENPKRYRMESFIGLGGEPEEWDAIVAAAWQREHGQAAA